MVNHEKPFNLMTSMTWSSPVRAQPGSPLICGASGAAACMDVCELCMVLCLPSFFPLCLCHFLSPTVDQKSWIKSELNLINHLTRSKIKKNSLKIDSEIYPQFQEFPPMSWVMCLTSTEDASSPNFFIMIHVVSMSIG